MWVRIMEDTDESSAAAPAVFAPGNTFQKRSVSSPAQEGKAEGQMHTMV